MKLFNVITTSLLGFAMAIGTGFAISQNKEVSRAKAAETSYTFTSKAWGDSTNSWTSTKDGGQLQSGRGVQVTTGASGAGATSKSAFNNVTSVEFTYSTNASAGVGNISVTIGSNTAVTYDVTKTGGTADRTTSHTYTTAQSGAISFTVTCTTNSIYVKSIKVTTSGGSDSPLVTDASIGNGEASNAKLVWSNIPGLTISQNKGSSNTAVNTSYNTPFTVRFYIGHVFAFVADTANGYALLDVKFRNSTNGDYYGGTYHASTTWSSETANISTDDTTKLTLTGCENTKSGSTSMISAKDTTNGVGAIYVSTTKQSRPSAITVSYIKPVAGDPTGIACSAQTVVVTETINLKNATTISPVGATTDLSFAIKSGNDKIDLDISTGVVTGKKGGSAVVTITPANTAGGATAIDVNITVTSIAAPGITVGNDYVIYAKDPDNGNFELTGVASNLGTTAAFTGDIPACSYVLSTEAGYYENTVAFKHGTSYLALTANSNNLHTSNTVNANASWKVQWNSTTHEAVVSNAVYGTRSIQFNYNNANSRFACYASENVAIGLYPYSVKALTDFTIDEEISVYKTGTATIGVTYTPADASDKELTWSSANESIATVDNGVVTGVAVGTTTITASKVINGQTVNRTCTVTVLNNQANHKGDASDPFDVSDAINVAKGILTKNSDGTDINLENHYYVKGLITAAVSRTTTQLTFWIGDNEDQINASTGGFEVYKAAEVYGTALESYYEGLTNADVARDFGVGYKVIVLAMLTVYNGTPETVQGSADIVRNNFIEASGFAKSFLDLLSTGDNAVCSADGDTDLEELQIAWALLAEDYTTLNEEAKELLVSITANKNGNDVQKATALYDYIVAKYGEQLESDDCSNYNFMGRTVVSGANPRINALINRNSNIFIVVIVSSILTISSLGLFFFLRKRRVNK